MRSANCRKFLITLMSGGLLFASNSCIPNRQQINSTVNTGILQGIGLALTLTIQQALTNFTIGTDTTTDTTTTE